MNFKELTMTFLATAIFLSLFNTEVSGRVVPKKESSEESQDPPESLTSNQNTEDVSTSKLESLPSDGEQFSIQTNQIVQSSSSPQTAPSEDETSSTVDLVGLPQELVLDLVAPLTSLDGSQAAGKKSATVYDHLMSLRDNLLGDPSPDDSKGQDFIEPSVAIASNTGNVNIDFHYNPVYTVYGHLNSMKDYLLGNSNSSSQMFQEPPEALKKAQDAFNANLDLVLRGVMEGMLPKVERIRREADSERRTFIDVFINFLGALMGRQQCSEIIACRTGKFVGYQVPGAGVIMMIMESLIPQSIRAWFNVVKTAVMDRSDNCDVEYLCTLVDDQ